MAKQNKSTSRKAAPRTNRAGASKPGDKLRLQGHDADRPGTAEERVAQPAGTDSRDARDENERGADRDRQDARNPQSGRDDARRDRH